MRTTTMLGLFAMGLAACGGSVETNGSGGKGGNAGSSAGGNGTGASAGGGTGGSAGSGGGGATTGSMTTSSTSTGTGAGCEPCDWDCCGSACVNMGNDINNCGACGNKCAGLNPYCDNGTCGEPPCNGPLCGPAGLCCGSQCCGAGELCCSIPGPIEQGPVCTKPDEAGTCPQGCAECVCASPDSAIATPSGEQAIRDLRAGDLVYSVDHGQVVAVPILEAVHVAAPHHVVVEVTLGNGRVIEMSPRHPTADGRTFAELRAGDSLQGALVAAVRDVPFRFGETYDILPDSDTGAYFAAGALVGSTLSPNAAQHCGEAAVPGARGGVRQ